MTSSNIHLSKTKNKKSRINSVPSHKTSKRENDLETLRKEIGNIFKRKNGTKVTAKYVDGRNTEVTEKGNTLNKKRQKDGVAHKRSQNTTGMRYTEDGLRLYREEDIVSSSGGNTKECPFVCECCF